tara:strand:+ start:65 stop:682 length:618 start_codon:yes stop_codon:yes gene_type:complete
MFFISKTMSALTDINMMMMNTDAIHSMNSLIYNISKSVVEKLANKFNFDIKEAYGELELTQMIERSDEPAVEKEKESKKTTKSKKTKETKETNTIEDKPKKKRGRPRKEQTKVDAVVSESYDSTPVAPIVNKLIDAVRSGEIEQPEAVKEIHDNLNIEDELTSETDVIKKTIDGIEYLVDDSNNVYDINSHDEIGKLVNGTLVAN